MQSILTSVGAALGAMWAFGTMPWWAGIAALVALLIAVALTSLYGALPREVYMDETPAPPCPEAQALIDALRRAGFASLGPRLAVAIKPVVLVDLLLHEATATLASVQQVQAHEPRVGYDCVTLFEDGRLLTSAALAQAGTLPPRRGCFMQIEVGAEPAQLFDCHRQAVALLVSHGLRPKPSAALQPAAVHAAMRGVLADQRDQLDAAPLRLAVTTLWRLSSGRNPHLRPLHEQLAADAVGTARTAH